MTERLKDLKARSKKVLIKVKPEVREKLVRFARTSRDPKTGESSPTKAEKRALQSTGDADKALACWQLTAILRDFGEEEFEKHVSDICQKSHQETVSQAEQRPKLEVKEMGEKKHFYDIEFEIPDGANLAIAVSNNLVDPNGGSIKFASEYQGWDFCKEILLALSELGEKIEFHPKRGSDKIRQDFRNDLRDTIVQILEKNGYKFIAPGEVLTDKLCPNCYHPDVFLVSTGLPANRKYRCLDCKAEYTKEEFSIS